LGLQKSNEREKEVDPFSQLGSPGKKNQKWAVPLDPNTILEKEGLNHQPVGSCKCFRIQAFHMTKLGRYLALVNE